MGRGVDEAKVRVWRERFVRFDDDDGGMKVEDFCLAEGISKSSFYNWRRKLARSKRRTPTTPQQKKQKKKKKKQQAVFEPVTIAAAAMVVIRLPGGTSIEVPAHSEQALRAIVGQLAAANNGAGIKEPEQETVIPEHVRRKKKKRRNEGLPEHLPRYEVEAEVSDADKHCEEHGMRQVIGYDRVETLEFERPKLRVRVTKYPKFA